MSGCWARRARPWIRWRTSKVSCARCKNAWARRRARRYTRPPPSRRLCTGSRRVWSRCAPSCARSRNA
uniref:Uncharacterized 7.9 kDa protein in PE 5'region n=1 Tax=Lymantria dispar multicapsid nuclear polyhedrosis virus TaxID=10449 RepID=YPE1_NPVLD|nr:RecName: Full=Uncharacterized 7.9 kDa protein in PE 5'region; AltName: Full=ORF1 [Lymantria dispar multiple nucleopolyhedrovirus]BAA07162.1 hypothetical protein [Lymantria dispar multiple nucleopolyhedrovirus]